MPENDRAAATSRWAVPVVDLGDDATVTSALAEACEQCGFFQLIGHGLPRALARKAQAEARTFFFLPLADKRAVSRSRDNPWGYYDRELTRNARDKKEIFDVGPRLERGGALPFEGSTPWPARLPTFQATLEAYYRAGRGLAARLLALIATTLGADPAQLAGQFGEADTSFLRLNHYPLDDPLDGDGGPPADLGIHHHTDAGALTILLQDEVPGLQVWQAGEWHIVPPREDALVVNIGDMVQVWSNDLYPAPLHRVLGMDSRERLSLAFFYNPSYDAMIAPLPRGDAGARPRYRPIEWGDFRRRRADGDYADYGAEVQIGDYRIPGID
jgi:isopenicillin N synthase-like dioxygenase